MGELMRLCSAVEHCIYVALQLQAFLFRIVDGKFTITPPQRRQKIIIFF